MSHLRNEQIPAANR